MRSMFQMGVNPGFFWSSPALGGRSLGQIDPNYMKGQLDQAMPQYTAVMNWMSQQTDVRAALGGGSDADLFQQDNSQVAAAYNSVSLFYQQYAAGGGITLTQDQYADIQAFIQLVPGMYMIIQQHGGIGGGAPAAAPVAAPAPVAPVAPAAAPAAQQPATAASAVQATAAAAPAIVKAVMAPKTPTPAAPKPLVPVAPPADNTVYYVVGGVAAAGLIAALALA